MNTLEELCSLLKQHFNIAESTVITSETNLEDLNLSSLDMVNLIIALEEKFNVEINEEKISKMKFIGDVVEFLESNCLNN